MFIDVVETVVRKINLWRYQLSIDLRGSVIVTIIYLPLLFSAYVVTIAAILALIVLIIGEKIRQAING